jgi:hypothetical protein
MSFSIAMPLSVLLDGRAGARHRVIGETTMRFQTGKYAGKTVEEVLLKAPDFAEWLILEHPENPHANDFKRLIRVLDQKRFTVRC